MTTETATAPAASPFPEHHRILIAEIFADAQRLAAKVEHAAAVTELTSHIESAKDALLAAARDVFAHFEALEAKAKAEVAKVETTFELDASEAIDKVKSFAAEAKAEVSEVEEYVSVDGVKMVDVDPASVTSNAGV